MAALNSQGGDRAGYCKGHPSRPGPPIESCDATRRPRPLSPSPAALMDPTGTSPALSVALAVLAVLLALTGFGIYTAFGPPSKRLTDPFDDHED